MLKPMSFTLGLLLVVSGFAAGQQVIEETQTTSAPGSSSEIRRVSQILGSNVRLQGENNYGKVEDIVLDENGTIDYLVVSKDDRYVMLPWNAGKFDYGQRVVLYDVAPQAIQPLFFQRNAWPTVADPQYTTRIRRVFPNARVRERQVVNPVPGTITTPGNPAVEQKVKLKRNGEIQVKERVR